MPVKGLMFAMVQRVPVVHYKMMPAGPEFAGIPPIQTHVFQKPPEGYQLVGQSWPVEHWVVSMEGHLDLSG